MNSIEDIAKMAIQEVGAEFEQMSVKQNSPKPLKSARLENSNLNLAPNQAENSSLSLENCVTKNSSQNSASNLASNLALDESLENSNDDLNFLKNSQSLAQVKNSALANAANIVANSEDERQFLSNLKERIEVLFAGLKTNDDDKTLRLELTIRFLEFLLAKTNERLSNL